MSNNLANETQNTTTPEKKEKPEIEVLEPIKFEANTEVAFINTIEATEVINQLFGDSFRDYCGSKVSFNDGNNQHLNSFVPAGKFYVSLYFKPQQNDCPIENLKTRAASAQGKNRFNTLLMMSGTGAGRSYDVTPETYEALNKFRFMPERPINWNNLTSETTSNFGFPGSYNQEVVACITGIDFEKILNVVYGTRTEEGIFQYQAVPAQFVANAAGEYLMQITRLDVRKLEDLRRSLGGPINRTEFHSFIR